MKPLADAQREVLAAMQRLPAAPVALADADGLVLAEVVLAPHPVPPFANSAVDGYAVHAADTVAVPADLAVIEDIPAGSVPRHAIEPGTSSRIMTGAILPEGADAVVMVEDTEPGDRAVRVMVPAVAGDNVRRAGGDLATGATVFEAGARLSPAHLGVLASIGVFAPLVVRRPVVAVLSTGDELVPADAPTLLPGMIRDSNRPMLVAMLRRLGVEVVDLGIVPDDEVLLRSSLAEAAARADAIVTSGGVSMGEHDLVKKVLAEVGTVDFWRVAMQPAKPFAFGFLDGTPLFGLPGNPVSVIVAFEQFVRPALLRRMGARLLFRPRGTGIAAEELPTDEAKTVFLRVMVQSGADGDQVSLAGGQASNVLTALAAADAFAVVPVGVGTVGIGEPVEIEWFHRPASRSLEEALNG